MDAYRILDLSPGATREEIHTAYRMLARRWHPDRFTEGPERDWANEKMCQINAAYSACLSGLAQLSAASAEDERLDAIEQMIEADRLPQARRELMAFDTRCARWNYLFGTLLLRQSAPEKARIYLQVAAHQQPDNDRYRKALADAAAVQESFTARLTGLFARRSGRNI